MDQDIIDIYSAEAIPTQVITIDRPECQEIDEKNDVIFVSNNNDAANNVESGTTSSTDTTKTATNTNNTTTTTTNTTLSSTSATTTVATTTTDTITTTAAEVAVGITTITSNDNETNNSNVRESISDGEANQDDNKNTNSTSNVPSRSGTRFKWTKEKSQVAMNLVQHGCKPRLVSIAVGCSLRTAQKFVETVTPKMDGEMFKTYEIRRRGRKSKDVNQRLNAIREVISRDSNITQAEIAADLKVSNTTVCRDLKRMGASWREKKSDQSSSMKLDNKKDRTPTRTKNMARGKQKKTSPSSVEIETIESQLFK